jgi:MtN3 and saliva related transmembrane protein
MHYLGQRRKHELSTDHKDHTPTTYLKFLDKLTFTVGVIGPFTVLPQIYTIFVSHSAKGVSLPTWALIFIVTFPWILYGFAHKDKSIIVSFILWEVANLSVVIGVLIYGK